MRRRSCSSARWAATPTSGPSARWRGSRACSARDGAHVAAGRGPQPGRAGPPGPVGSSRLHPECGYAMAGTAADAVPATILRRTIEVTVRGADGHEVGCTTRGDLTERPATSLRCRWSAGQARGCTAPPHRPGTRPGGADTGGHRRPVRRPRHRSGRNVSRANRTDGGWRAAVCPPGGLTGRLSHARVYACGLSVGVRCVPRSSAAASRRYASSRLIGAVTPLVSSRQV